MPQKPDPSFASSLPTVAQLEKARNASMACVRGLSRPSIATVTKLSSKWAAANTPQVLTILARASANVQTVMLDDSPRDFGTDSVVTAWGRFPSVHASIGWGPPSPSSPLPPSIPPWYVMTGLGTRYEPPLRCRPGAACVGGMHFSSVSEAVGWVTELSGDLMRGRSLSVVSPCSRPDDMHYRLWPPQLLREATIDELHREHERALQELLGVKPATATIENPPAQPTRPVSLAYAARKWYTVDPRTLKKMIREGTLKARQESPRLWIFDLADVTVRDPSAVKDAAP